MIELDSSEVKEIATKSPAPVERNPFGIKLTLTSNTKSTMEAQKRQQSKKALMAATEDCDSNIISSESDSD